MSRLRSAAAPTRPTSRTPLGQNRYMRRRNEPGRPPRATAPVAVALSAAATLIMVAIAYAGAANPSVPGAITFGPVPTRARSTAATGTGSVDLAADPTAAARAVSPGAAHQPATLTDPTPGHHSVTAGDGSGPSYTAAPADGGPAKAATPPVGSQDRSVPTDSSAAAVVPPTVTPPASAPPTTAPAATLVAPPPPVTTPVASVPLPVNTATGSGAATSKVHSISGTKGAAPAPTGHESTAGSTPESSAAPSVVAPQYPVVNAQSARYRPARVHSGNDPSGNQPGRSGSGASKGD